MDEATVRTRKWTRLEYERLAEAEILGPGDRIELLGGDMIVKEPQYSPHVTGVRLVQRVLERAFGAGWDVRPQMPVALDEESEPEPDICVVPGDPRDYRDAHPARPVLIVEVSLSRLGFDRERKGSLYARAAIADYWIVNIPDRRVEVSHMANRRSTRELNETAWSFTSRRPARRRGSRAMGPSMCSSPTWTRCIKS
jgi:Uma2 family endonuclease